MYRYKIFTGPIGLTETVDKLEQEYGRPSAFTNVGDGTEHVYFTHASDDLNVVRADLKTALGYEPVVKYLYETRAPDSGRFPSWEKT